MKSHERFKWAIEKMDIKPNEHILEIGCGVGFAVHAVGPLLSTGKITAIDRSPSAVSRARKRNESAIQEGKIRIVKADLLSLPKPWLRYNKVFCFNINFFWTKRSISKECNVIKSALAADGTLYIFYGPMIANGWKKIAVAVSKNLSNEQLHIKTHGYDKSVRCLYLTACK
jgi:cyclopropane fatty-acyl-phospholipid synthase-like methyltransferase